MALVGISKHDEFPYVSNADPCKKHIPAKPAKTMAADGVVEEPVPASVEILEGATTFKLTGLDVFMMGRIYDNSSRIIRTGDKTDEVGFQTSLNATAIEAVRFGLKGWENFKDATGNDLKFTSVNRNVNGRDYTCASDETLNMLGIQLISELGDEIKRVSNVSEKEAKNSV